MNRIPQQFSHIGNLHVLVPFRVTDVGEASEPAGYSSRSFPDSVTRAIIDYFAVCFKPFFSRLEVKLLWELGSSLPLTHLN